MKRIFSPSQRLLISAAMMASAAVMVFAARVGTVAAAEPVAKAELAKAAQDTRFASGSGISLSDLTEVQLQQLTRLIRVWGFVKYFHNGVAAGEHNMDGEFIALLPDILKASSSDEANKLLSRWLTGMGDNRDCGGECTQAAENPYLAVDMGWINDRYLGAELSTQLQHLYKNRKFTQHYYNELQAPGIAKPINELGYAGAEVYSDDGLKLLSLARYWNLVQYFSPYRALEGVDWPEVPAKIAGIVVKADTQLEYGKALFQLMNLTRDSHAFIAHPIYFEVFGARTAPLVVRYIESSWVVTRVLGDKSGIVAGDIIETIDGLEVNKHVDALKPLIAASNESRSLYNIGEHLLNTQSEAIELGFKGGKKVTLTTLGLREHQQGVAKLNLGASHRLLAPGIGYLDLALLTPEEVDKVMPEYLATKSLIIDVRNYPNRTYRALIKYLYPEPREFASYLEPSLETPGQFTLHGKDTAQGLVNPEYYKGQLILLADASSQSHAEFTLMALRRAPNAVVVGSQTSGADGNTFNADLPGGYSAVITGLGVLTPVSKLHTQGIGIIPDVEVLPQLKDIREGRDRVLEEALALATSGKFSALVANKTQL
ncbi:S41 family peptidase [Shewanella khirikhana]|uniref:S41 family peptidase n=1 Tax=Shewanella khirikhana TaxID=1965282 RepID=UPI0030CEBF1F